MFALLKNEKDKDGRTEYLIEAKRMGIPIKLPHINDSSADFKIEGKGIRFGLTAIKYISDNIASKYIAARPFKSYQELEEFTFTKGNGVNSRALQALRVIGAANFPDNPRNEQEIKENLYDYLIYQSLTLPFLHTIMLLYKRFVTLKKRVLLFLWVWLRQLSVARVGLELRSLTRLDL
jgi:DNA polymerase III subunit alpha